MRIDELIKTDPRVKGFPNEKDQEQMLSEVANILATKCSSAVEKVRQEKRIYRGMKSTGIAYVGNPGIAEPRKSANTLNYYTLICDNSPQWAAYPKRSESFICSNSKWTASSYGEVYVAFPIDGTIIGQCPDSDMWFSFKLPDRMSLEDFANEINNILLLAHRLENPSPVNKKVKFEYNIRKLTFDHNVNEFKDALNKAQQTFLTTKFTSQVLKYNPMLGDMIKANIMSQKDGLWNLFSQWLDPAKNGFSRYPIEQYEIKRMNKELWFSAPAVFVKEHYAHTAIRLIK